MLGDGTVSLMSPLSSQNTSAVFWTPVVEGSYDLYAVIDPEDVVSETDETNNVIVRSVTVLAAGPETISPHVDSFTINQGAPDTTSRNVALDTVVSDPDPSSGIETLFFVEFEYLTEVEHWVPTHNSGWLPFDESHANFPWQLQSSAGTKYLHAWARDMAGNISLFPYKASITHLPPSDVVEPNEARIYRHELKQGEQLVATLTPISGDPDLYIWAPDHATRPPWVSNLDVGTDQIRLVAPIDGLYQIEVYGYTAADYQLTVEIEPGVIVQAAQSHNIINRNTEKPIRNGPIVPLFSTPGLYMPDVEPIQLEQQHRVFLPIIQQ